jgi:hypothetical protein
MADQVNHPKHYNSHPAGIECIDVVEHMPFNLGNAVKYLWRSDHKGAQLQDLDKAIWYINREKERLIKANENRQAATPTPGPIPSEQKDCYCGQCGSHIV